MKSEYDFDLAPTEINFAPRTQTEEILQNVIAICTTAKGSVPMDRMFGVDARFLDEPVSEARSRYITEVVLAVKRFEPRAKITRVRFEGDTEGHVYPRVSVKIKE